MAELVRSLEEMVEAEGVAPFWWGVVVEPFRRLWWTGSYRVPEPVGASSSRFRLLGACRAADVLAATGPPLTPLA